MGNLIFKKIVDQSLLNAGMTIPVENHQKLLEALSIVLKKGEKQRITVKIAGKEYKALLTFVDYSEKYAGRAVLQIRYGAKSPICQALNSIFAYSAGKIAQMKAETTGEKKQLSVEEEYVEICSSEEMTLEFKCHCKNAESPMGTGKCLLNREYVYGKPEEELKNVPSGDEEELDTKEIVSKIKNYIASKGFSYPIMMD